jgi:MFS family permease
MSELPEEKKTAEEPKTISEIIFDAFRELKETFIAFVKAPKALWGVNVPYVIEGLVYFGILTILGKFGSENVGLTDIQSGWVYSFVTGGITLAMVVLGGYSDKIGVRMSLILSFVAILFGRILISMSDTIAFANGFLSPMFFVMVVGLFLVVVGYGLYQPESWCFFLRLYFTLRKTPYIYNISS